MTDLTATYRIDNISIQYGMQHARVVFYPSPTCTCTCAWVSDYGMHVQSSASKNPSWTHMHLCLFHLLHALWYQTMVSDYGIRLWYQTMVSDYGIRLWYQTMVSDYGIRLWYQTMVSDYGIRLWYQTMVSDYGIRLWYQTMVSDYYLNFGWTKKNVLEQDLNLRPPDWRAGALPTELTSPILAVSLFCQYLCSGAPVRSHETIYMYCPLFSQGSRPSYDTTWEEAVRGCTIKGYNFFSTIIYTVCTKQKHF